MTKESLEHKNIFLSNRPIVKIKAPTEKLDPDQFFVQLDIHGLYHYLFPRHLKIQEIYNVYFCEIYTTSNGKQMNHFISRVKLI